MEQQGMVEKQKTKNMISFFFQFILELIQISIQIINTRRIMTKLEYVVEGVCSQFDGSKNKRKIV